MGHLIVCLLARASLACITAWMSHSLSLKSLGGPGCEGHAKTIMGWLEHGCFDALGKGYLKKAVLCIAADQSSKEVLEAWSISVAWHTDANGVEHPTLQTGGPRSKRTLALKSPRVGHKYTMNYARKTSQALLRQMVRLPGWDRRKNCRRIRAMIIPHHPVLSPHSFVSHALASHALASRASLAMCGRRVR